jgi:hypothetical protein
MTPRGRELVRAKLAAFLQGAKEDGLRHSNLARCFFLENRSRTHFGLRARGGASMKVQPLCDTHLVWAASRLPAAKQYRNKLGYDLIAQLYSPALASEPLAEKTWHKSLLNGAAPPPIITEADAGLYREVKFDCWPRKVTMPGGSSRIAGYASQPQAVHRTLQKYLREGKDHPLSEFVDFEAVTSLIHREESTRRLFRLATALAWLTGDEERMRYDWHVSAPQDEVAPASVK